MDVVRRTVCVGLLVTAAGCGSSDSKSPSPQTTTQASTTTATQKAEAPLGKLSAAEYREIHDAVTELAKVERSKSPARAVREVNAACDHLATETVLVQRIDSVCEQTVRAVRALRALETHKHECSQALNAGDVSCYSNLFRTIGRAARVYGVRGLALNAEVRHRRFAGACAKALGISRKDLANADATTHHAISAANAAERRDGDAFTRATARLQEDLQADDGGSPREDLRHLKSCR